MVFSFNWVVVKRAQENAMVFSWVRVTRSLVVFLMFCRSLFVLVLLSILLSVLLLFMDSDYPFVIFKLFKSCSKTVVHFSRNPSSTFCGFFMLYSVKPFI